MPDGGDDLRDEETDLEDVRGNEQAPVRRHAHHAHGRGARQAGHAGRRSRRARAVRPPDGHRKRPHVRGRHARQDDAAAAVRRLRLVCMGRRQLRRLRQRGRGGLRSRGDLWRELGRPLGRHRCRGEGERFRVRGRAVHRRGPRGCAEGLRHRSISGLRGGEHCRWRQQHCRLRCPDVQRHVPRPVHEPGGAHEQLYVEVGGVPGQQRRQLHGAGQPARGGRRSLPRLPDGGVRVVDGLRCPGAGRGLRRVLRLQLSLGEDVRDLGAARRSHREVHHGRRLPGAVPVPCEDIAGRGRAADGPEAAHGQRAVLAAHDRRADEPLPVALQR
mmetsp:Transcript_57098/g.162692  ORF Transcript_57098/g.162692 Transcript_57098/m.162692 type:complete len:329 (-) Transcript_57098:1512-2498(-)